MFQLYRNQLIDLAMQITWLVNMSEILALKGWSITLLFYVAFEHGINHCRTGLIFSSVVSGLCYVPPTKTIWIAAGSSDIPMYDPKSGDNVSQQ